MNKVYLSGVIYDQPQMTSKEDAAPHLVFQLSVKHRSKVGVRQELYRISAWHGTAAFCASNLVKGMRIAVQGYLTQRSISVGDKMFTAVEVAADEVFLPASVVATMAVEDQVVQGTTREVVEIAGE